jgi:hypothetical protein
LYDIVVRPVPAGGDCTDGEDAIAEERLCVKKIRSAVYSAMLSKQSLELTGKLTVVGEIEYFL